MYIYTDGACSGKTNIGGWGICYSVSDKIVKRKGATMNTTNNRMELQAIIEAMNEYMAYFSSNSVLVIFSDSAYAIGGCTEWMKKWKKNGWKNAKGEPVKNADLWEIISARIYELKVNKNVEVKFQKVAGHSGNIMNEIADKLAVSAREEMELLWA